MLLNGENSIFCLFMIVLCWLRCRCIMTANESPLCDSGGLESQNFMFCTNLSNSFLLFTKLQKKPIKLAFADYEAQTFNLNLTPPFCKTFVNGSSFIFFAYNIVVSIQYQTFLLLQGQVFARVCRL